MRKYRREIIELILGLVMVVVAFALIIGVIELHEYLMLKSMD
jgi:cell division protein FtsB